MGASTSPATEGRVVELTRLDNVANAIVEIIELLNVKSGKDLPSTASLPGGVVAHIKKTGMRSSVKRRIAGMQGRRRN